MEKVGAVDSNFNTSSNRTRRFKKSKFNTLLLKFKRKVLGHFRLMRLILISGSVVLLLASLYIGGIYLFRSRAGVFIESVYDVFVLPDKNIKSIGGRTNILFLVKVNEENSEVIKPVIFMSLDTESKNPVFVSVPENVWTSDLNSYYKNVYRLGNEKSPGGGLILAKRQAEVLLGQPIQYGVVIPYAETRSELEKLSGKNIEINEHFAENDIKFKEGLDEILSIIFNKSLILNTDRYLDFFDYANNSFETDMDRSASLVIAKRVYLSRKKISIYLIPENLIAKPQSVTAVDLHTWVGCVMSQEKCE